MASVYVPRTPTAGVLYGVVRAHLAAFVTTVETRTDGVGLPSFVRAEFDKFLRCGVLAHGFARVRCGACGFERLLPFSCKGPRSTPQKRPGIDRSKPATGVGGGGTDWFLPHALRPRQGTGGRGRRAAKNRCAFVRRVSRLESGAGL
jgi:hypothetical protein